MSDNCSILVNLNVPIFSSWILVCNSTQEHKSHIISHLFCGFTLRCAPVFGRGSWIFDARTLGRKMTAFPPYCAVSSWPFDPAAQQDLMTRPGGMREAIRRPRRRAGCTCQCSCSRYPIFPSYNPPRRPLHSAGLCALAPVVMICSPFVFTSFFASFV